MQDTIEPSREPQQIQDNTHTHAHLQQNNITRGCETILHMVVSSQWSGIWCSEVFQIWVNSFGTYQYYLGVAILYGSSFSV